MKRFGLKSLYLLMSAYFLLISSGLTLSHVSCNLGSRWVLGAEMPDPVEKMAQVKCPFSGKTCKKDNSKTEPREIATCAFAFQHDGQTVSFDQDNLSERLPGSDRGCLLGFRMTDVPEWIDIDSQKHPNFRGKPPTPINQRLASLQVFRI